MIYHGKCQGCGSYEDELSDIMLCENCAEKLEKEDGMSDSEMWADYKEDRKAKRKWNGESSTKILRENGIAYQVMNEGNFHYRIGDWDFWASTGKFWNLKTNEKGRGVFNLINKLNEQQKEKK